MQEQAPQQVLRLPGFVAWAMRPLPLLPLEIALGRLVKGIVARHPELVGRLNGSEWRCVAVDPNDLPFVILLDLREGTLTLRLARTLDSETAHARIPGPLIALVGLVDGVYDGDALFFSRDLVIEGDIETVLALRNAIDDADIGLLREIAALLEPYAAPFDRVGRSAIAVVRRTLGLGGAEHRGNAS